MRASGTAEIEPAYRLTRPTPPPPREFTPDRSQQRVLDHGAGPLLVLAGPGTGKTSTLVEYVARRVEAGLEPSQVLTLTFSRKAAHELRERLSTRLDRPLAVPLAWTFHSWCYAWVRERQAQERALAEDLLDDPSLTPVADPLRLLSGAEQDVAVRDLLLGSLDSGLVAWPELLRGCLTTAGLAREVRAVLARLAELGMGGEDFAAIARRAGRPDWSALATFSDEYLDALDATGVLDYGELLRRAVTLAESPAGMSLLRSRYAVVVVDEYQDTDPLQERLLSALAGDGRDLVAVGDPDQSIYRFRGTDVGQLLAFTGRFPRADGSPAPTLALGVSRRCGPTILAAAHRVSTRVPAPGLSGPALAEHRSLTTIGPADATVSVTTHFSANAEAQAIASELRHRHLRDGVAWHDMAVLVRSATRSLPLLRRVLTASGIPIASAADELPLTAEPAATALLTALRCAADATALTAEVAHELLTGPLVGADPAVLRRLARHLRAAARAAGQAQPPSSSEVLRAAVASASMLAALPETLAWPARRLGELLIAARAEPDPESALWAIWSRSAASARWRRESDAGGPAGRAADRALDGVVSLFDYVGRASESRRGVTGIGTLLAEIEAQHIPADAGRESEIRESGVRLMTAHRSKGLEWDVVVVAGVQEGVWPDLRRRASLLEPDRIGWPLADGSLPAPVTSADLLGDERRLLYVAMTRARRRLVVTAVSSPEEDGPRPSRFLSELGIDVVAKAAADTPPLTLAALVRRLRALAGDRESAAVRAAAAARLARLAVTVDAAGSPLVPAADPDTWWAVRRQTTSTHAVRDPDLPIALSGSSLASLDRCPLQWFLEHEAHAQREHSAALSFGSVVHALAKEVVDGATPPDLDALTVRLDSVWDQLSYEAPWQSAQQREVALSALGRFLTWHTLRRDRQVVGAEIDYAVTVEVPLPDGAPAESDTAATVGTAVAMADQPGSESRSLGDEGNPGRVTVSLRGSFDRVELDSAGLAWIVDYKTERQAKTRSEVARHPQLGTYQLAVRNGALDDVLDRRPAVAGAELVQLKLEGPTPGTPLGQPQEPLSDEAPTWIEVELGRAAGMVLAEEFHPQVGNGCTRCAYRITCPAQADGAQVLP